MGHFRGPGSVLRRSLWRRIGAGFRSVGSARFGLESHGGELWARAGFPVWEAISFVSGVLGLIGSLGFIGG